MIYFDNAATTFPKPPEVMSEVTRCITQWCGNPGRGAHRLSVQAAEKIYTCRELLARFFGLPCPERIIFTQNTTYALNMTLKGLIREGDHVLCSELEHNAVRRPLHALQKERAITYDTFPVIGLSDDEILAGIAARINKKSTVLVTVHASNICSVSLPLAAIGALCKRHGLFFVVDAAQSAGHLPIDMQAMQIDALAAPGHKGLLGIQGCGILALGEGISPHTLIEGGSGVNSLSPTMPDELPERLEAGTLPTPAIASLLGSLPFLSELGVSEAENRFKALFFAARERIEALDGFKIYQREHPGAVLLFQKSGLSAGELARVLDKNGIAVRAGLHCAPTAHRALGTPPGGAVRLGFGLFNTVAELDTLWRVLRDL